MTEYPILFNQTPESLRRIGARGGRTRARNWRRPAACGGSGPGASPIRLPRETTAQAIAVLEAKFPWLGQA